MKDAPRRRYAEGTEVSVDKTHADIRKLLNAQRDPEGRKIVTGIAIGGTDQVGTLMFEMNRTLIRFTLPLPSEAEFTKRGAVTLTPAMRRQAIEQRHRERWRALYLALKSKLVAIEAGIQTFEEEFLANVVIKTPEGGFTTLGEAMTPQLEDARQRGDAPRLLPYFGGS